MYVCVYMWMEIHCHACILWCLCSTSKILYTLNVLYTDPDAPELTLTSITSDTMTLSWAVAGGTEVERYELEWKIIGGQKPISRLSYTLSSTTNNYTIAGLEECDNVTVEVRVAAVNEAGTTSSVPLSLNSAILRGRAADSEDEDITCSSCVMSTSNIGAIIAGVVGALLIGVFIGSVTVVIISRCTQNCRKKNKLAH